MHIPGHLQLRLGRNKFHFKMKNETHYTHLFLTREVKFPTNMVTFTITGIFQPGQL